MNPHQVGQPVVRLPAGTGDPRGRFPHTPYPPPLSADQVQRRYATSATGLPPGRHAPTLFPIATAADGTINTLLLVEAGEAVPWTKPDELVYDPAAPLPELGGVYGDGFFAVSVAGAVVFVSKGTDEQVVRALITCDGNETVTDRGLLDQSNAPFPRTPGPPVNPGKP